MIASLSGKIELKTDRYLILDVNGVGYKIYSSPSILKEYCHIEQLVNLGALPAHGFKVSVLPLKIIGASAAPARVVAIMGD